MKESRLEIWKSSLNIARDNFVFGVGTGDIQDELNKEYKEPGNTGLDNANNLNAHNQLLEVLLENGFIGIVFFLSLFVMMTYIAVKEHNHIYLMFNIIVFVSFMFESMLNRLAGVSFFSLFSFMLLYAGSNKQNHQIKNNVTNQFVKIRCY
jgi:O-antigen ligase